VRIVSVKASFAPLTVFSDSGGAGERFSPVLVSKSSACLRPGKSTAQLPCTSPSATASAEAARLMDAQHTAPPAACRKSSSIVPGTRLLDSGRSTKSAIWLPEVSPSRKKTVTVCPPASTRRSTRSAAPPNSARTASALGSVMRIPPFSVILPVKRKKYAEQSGLHISRACGNIC